MRFNVEYRPLMDFKPLPRVQWRRDHLGSYVMVDHPEVSVAPAKKGFTCRCAGEEANMSTLHGAMTWCEHNLHNTATVE